MFMTLFYVDCLLNALKINILTYDKKYKIRIVLKILTI